jgi:hypothetical protein
MPKVSQIDVKKLRQVTTSIPWELVGKGLRTHDGISFSRKLKFPIYGRRPIDAQSGLHVCFTGGIREKHVIEFKIYQNAVSVYWSCNQSRTDRHGLC